MKEMIKWFLSVAINPSITTRKWTVMCSDWGGGYFKSFWFKRNALIYAENQHSVFVNIENEINMTRIRFRDNSSDYPPPVRYV